MERSILLEFCAIFFVLYILGLYIYRAFFDSLSHIPGPELAAASLWYEFYYDVVKKDRYTFKLKELHAEYGQCKCDQGHPKDSTIEMFQAELSEAARASPRTQKHLWETKQLGLETAFIATESHELHRIRRNALAHYFSKASLQRLEPGVQYQIDKLVSRLQNLKGSGRIVNLLDVFTSLTGDIIAQYSFAKPYGFLDDPEFAPYWHKVAMEVSQNGHMVKQFPWLMPLMKAMPRWMVKMVQPQMMTLLDFQDGFHKQVVDVKAEMAAGEKPTGQTTIFYDVLSNPNVRPQEKETNHLRDEAQTIVGAGSVITRHILAILTFYITTNPPIRARLEAEIGGILTRTNGQPKWTRLEQLPFLTAVITERLRIGYGVSHRLQRVFPDTILQYKEYAIPTMTTVSMTSVLLHDDSSHFPNPRTFNPDRFIENPQLKKHLVPFSRGSRACVGLNLAYAELYLTLAAMFVPGRFNFNWFETDISDVETKHDFLNTSPRLDSKGIRVTIN